ncbi:hypothetical protein DPMN_107367 [Dreissena polymorpha]|uniref:Uncharacterized protein n=1 Tax=Dreissena polymorpha TaxID=45954 RepID=A0A9D4K6Y2_DREPO|nr:hypothetical protein DPMN_107367 [Dreissena polymorpha]
MWILAVLVTLLLWEATSVNTACTFPAELTGVWYSTSFGTLTFTSTSFTGFTSPDLPNTFDCEESSDTKYLVKAPNDVFGERIYLCMEMTAVSAVKYIVRFENNVDNSTGERFYFGPPVGVTLSAGCNRTDTRSGGEYELFIKKDNLSEALTACPGSLMSQFWVVVTSSAAVNCSNTTLDGQQPGLLAFNYSSCVTGMFNKGGILQCLYSTSSDYTYVTLYNNDTTVNGVTTYQFTCMALSKSGSLLTASEYPKRCHTGQTPTSVTSPGILYNMADLLNADNSSSSSNNNVLIIVLCTIGGAIVIAIIIIILYLKIFRKKEEAPKIRKAKSKISITDYTPRMERVSSLEKGVNLVNKQSSGEVLTGIMEGRKNKKVMGDAYEPPKKEKWQKQWEKSPRLDGSLKESKRKSASAVNIPTHELDKAYTVASSLPESVDLPDIPQDTAKRRPADGVPVFSTRLGVLEKSHASPKIPRSTGKFGGSPDSYQFPEEGVPSPPEPRLDTITENPFSRENTGTSGLAKSLREHPDMITGLKNRGADSMNTFRTTSTASVGDIRLGNSLQNVSRISHLSASNATIFDDPDWLLQNAATDNPIVTLKNLLPSLPKQRDTNWFLKMPKRTDSVGAREDLLYINNRTRRSIGLNNSADWAMKKSSSLEIIEREKRRRKEKAKRNKTVVLPASPHSGD